MANYIIGDVHGCLDTLRQLIYEIDFDLEKDYAWFTGDLVNRGPHSIEAIRFIKAFGKHAICVLGNHDISLLRKYYCNIKNPLSEKLFRAKDHKALTDWLSSLPLFYYDEKLKLAMVHAGIHPDWNLDKLLQLNKEVETELQKEDKKYFFENIFGNTPDTWDESLTGIDRLRYIVNCFTRVRFIEPNGQLKLETRLKDNSTTPIWFNNPLSIPKDITLFFGHFAALNGKCDVPGIEAMDTGCVWGGYLSAYCVETKVVTKVRLIDDVDNSRIKNKD